MIFQCIRVYPNYEAMYTIRDQSGMESWLEYQKQFRWGNLLFINGERVEETGSGYFSDKDHEILSAAIKAMTLPDLSVNQGITRHDTDGAYQYYGSDRYLKLPVEKDYGLEGT